MSDASSNAMTTQVETMNCPLYQVGVLQNEQMLLRTWEAPDIRKSIGWLKARNAAGAAIYIRPHNEHRLNLVDDLKPAALTQMKRDGFQPLLVIETSPNNLQAWLDHGRILTKDLSTAAARALAERFGGDLGSADWRHFGRLAGLTNRKEKYRRPNDLFPFVRLIEANPGRIYDRAASFLSDIERARENELIARARSAEQSKVMRERGPQGPNKTIQDFHQDHRYSGDLSRADLAYCVYAFGHGLPETAIRAALLSRDLSKKGSEARIEDYIRRTMVKAAETITSLPVRPSQPDRTRELSR